MLEMIFWDVQHGSSAFLSTPGGKKMIFDLGIGSYTDKDKTFSPILHLKNKYKIKGIDALVITHPHRDHIDDIDNFYELPPIVLSRPKHLTDEEIKNANRKDDQEIVDKYLQISKKYTDPVKDENNPFLSQNNGGVTFKPYFPKSCATSNINNHSVVTVISFATCKIIIPGDNEPASWNELLKDDTFKNDIKNTHILLAPHHGRDSGFSKELFEQISPHLVIISDGRFSDSSATDRYSKNATGWKVYSRGTGDVKERKCVTTRDDGVIVVKFGMDSDSKKPFMNVTIA